MNHHQETLQTWNKVAALYQEMFMDLDLYNESYDFFCNAINVDKAEILEIGCGPGNISKYILSKRPDFALLGIDYAPNMVKLAQQNIPNASFSVMDCKEIRSINKKFDGIVCGFCLPYLSPEECAQLISDANYLLNKRGVFYFSFVEGDPEQSGYKTGSSGDRTYFYYHQHELLGRQLKKRGFEEINTFIVNYHQEKRDPEVHTILFARKIETA
jgi:cyclopropane fatty-acyl-phospholipid synthase-like methyltransferase